MKIGRMEEGKSGVVEYWSDGVLEHSGLDRGPVRGQENVKTLL
jgi:hypothetical protein